MQCVLISYICVYLTKRNSPMVQPVVESMSEEQIKWDKQIREQKELQLLESRIRQATSGSLQHLSSAGGVPSGECFVYICLLHLYMMLF